jgi:hypothetical protein
MPVAPLIAVRIDETEHSGLSNRSIRFSYFKHELPTPCLIHVRTHFGDLAGESTTSSIKKGGSSPNGSDLNNDNIFKPTFDTLMEENGKALEAYYVEVDELFFSRHETR